MIHHLPIPTGPYKIGFKSYDLYDPSRKEIHYPDGRLIPIRVYFPMEKGNHEVYEKTFEKSAPITSWGTLKTKVFSKHADPKGINKDFLSPVVMVNPGYDVAITDYSYLVEDLASHGYIVVTIQNQLLNEKREDGIFKDRSYSRFANVIDNNLHVFSWLQKNKYLFNNQINTKRLALLGHSMGGNALLGLMSRLSDVFKKRTLETLMPHMEQDDIYEAVITLDARSFSYPVNNTYPLLLLMAEDNEVYQKDKGFYDEMIRIGHNVQYYKGSKHISFMDHGHMNPKIPSDPDHTYFNGDLKDREEFVTQIRKDVLTFLSMNNITVL